MAHNVYFAAAYDLGARDRRAGKPRTNPYVTADHDTSTSSRDGWFAGYDDEDRSLRTGEEHTSVTAHVKLSEWTREQCIDWLEKHDRDGDYCDEATAAQGLPPLSLEDAQRLVHDSMAEVR